MALAFSAAMKKFFGYKDGEGLHEFMDEMRALNMEDKLYFHDLLIREPGFEETKPPVETPSKK